MRKIKVGSIVKVINGDNTIYTVVSRVKGSITNRANYHGGIMFDGFHRKPSKYKLNNGEVYKPEQLTTKI